MHVEQTKLILLHRGENGGLSWWSSLGYPADPPPDTHKLALQMPFCQFKQGGITSPKQGKAGWIHEPNNFKQRLFVVLCFFFFFATQYIYHSEMFSTCRIAGWFKFRRWERKGTEQRTSFERLSWRTWEKGGGVQAMLPSALPSIVSSTWRFAVFQCGVWALETGVKGANIPSTLVGLPPTVIWPF